MLIDLTKDYLEEKHIFQILQAFTNKYTMRSKAYRTMLRYFLRTAINLSTVQFEKMTSEKTMSKIIITKLNEIELNVQPSQGIDLNSRWF